ncbi:MAG: response regulator [Sterolibacterium sp.]|nr:response regulator [Sterolibacterium sp.]
MTRGDREIIINQPEIIDKQTVFLVVDDFEPMRKVTSGQLRSMGAGTILTANDGAQALRMLKEQRVDIVLSDWNMPVMSGLELLQAMHAVDKLSRLPFIMITAEAERHRIDNAIACGVSDMLVKPYTTDRFAKSVVKALRPRSSSSVPVHLAFAENGATLATSLATAPPAASAEPVSQDAQKPARPTILVVDDTPDHLLLISHLFKDEYCVRIAHSGGKALDICQSNDPPDLVLLDIMMPGMDGFEVARRMREHPTSETIPVIFVSAMTGEEAHLKGMELGAVDFVEKPIDPVVLKPRVRNFMRYVGLHKQLQAEIDGMLELAHLREDVERITRHDMKGPLAGVIGLVQALAEDNSMSHKHVEQLRVIEETALQVLNMINLSSELFKIETGHFKLDAQPVKIGAILRRVVEISRVAFAEKHLIISVDTDVPLGVEMPLALGDAMLCYSLFHNLVKNACEAAPESSRVSVTLVDGTPLRILIQNQGAVPVEIRDRFFDKFVTNGKQAGTGLGTYSARLLAEAQYGAIALAVSDQEGQTTITVTLPRYAGEWLLRSAQVISMA